MNVLSFDCETRLIGKDNVAPEMICASFGFLKDGLPITRLVSNGDPSLREWCARILAPGHMLVGHNIAYDIGVLIRTFPDLEPLVWQKVEAREISDTMLREMLLNLSSFGDLGFMTRPDGSKDKIAYDMGSLVADYFGEDITAGKDDDDAVRMRYEEMDGIPAAHYPQDFAHYAREDAAWTIKLYQAQVERTESQSSVASCSTAWFHTNASICLFLMTMRGMVTDPAEFHKLQEMVLQETTEEKLKPAIDAGLLVAATPALPYKGSLKKARAALECDWDETDPRWAAHQEALEAEGIKFKAAKKGKKSMKTLHAYVEKVCLDNGLPVKRNKPSSRFPEGSIACDSEVIDSLVGLDREEGVEGMTPLETYKHRQKLDKLITTEIPRMMWPRPKDDPDNAKLADVVHFPFKTLVNTTRTSSSSSALYPSANGQNVDPRARRCYRARDGFLLSSRDYSSLELCTVAQVTYNLFGASVHRDRINAGYDMHGFLGSQLAAYLSPEFSSLCAKRQIIDDPSAIYKAFMSCKNHDNQKISDFFDHWRKFAKPVGLGFPGGLGPRTFISIAKKTYGVDIIQIAMGMSEHQLEVTDTLLWHVTNTFGLDRKSWSWTPLLKGFALAIMLKQIWLATYPEMVEFFEHVKNSTDPSNEEKLCYTSPMGMFRAGADFCAAANGECMQTPAAEGAKSAVIRVTRACRDKAAGSILFGRAHPVDFIHDEILTEVQDEVAHDLDAEIGRLMEAAMQEVTPDVKSTTEGALMVNWDKRAKPVFDGGGKLTVWVPK